MSIIKNLALCGGGFYGYAEIGAMQVFKMYEKYINIENIAGVSVGSIVATLYAVGYNYEEMREILFSMDFSKLIQDKTMPYANIYKTYGMYNAKPLKKEIDRLIEKKTGIKKCTFADLPCNLIIATTNLNYQSVEIFSKDSTPNMIVSKAVRMSISYPGYISPVLWNGNLYTDGGVSVHYPIVLFKNLSETLGITFAAHNENIDGTLVNRMEIKTMSDFIKSLGVTLSRSTYISQIKQEHLDRSIIVKIPEPIDSMELNITNEQKVFLYECGMKAAKEQLDKLIGTNVYKDLCDVLDEISNNAGNLEHSFELIHN